MWFEKQLIFFKVVVLVFVVVWKIQIVNDSGEKEKCINVEDIVEIELINVVIRIKEENFKFRGLF